MKYLTSCGGIAHIGDKSTPEEISKVFMLSKSAFKRAIGSLYKDGLIELYDYKIILK